MTKEEKITLLNQALELAESVSIALDELYIKHCKALAGVVDN